MNIVYLPFFSEKKNVAEHFHCIIDTLQCCWCGVQSGYLRRDCSQRTSLYIADRTV